MELINLLNEDEVLQIHIRPECEDEGLCVDFEESIDKNTTIVLKVDDFYNGLNLAETPASIDCLIIQFCGDNTYKLSLVELKNVERARLINPKNLREKFETTLYDFMSNRFRDYFYNEAFDFKIELILCAGKLQNDNSFRSYKLDFLLGLKPFRFDGKLIGINGLPPIPIIRNCQ
ncbi:MAG: hypothetical protein AB8G86_06815 [Saprospiraceae bacterium]